MTELDLTTAIQPTALADHLAGEILSSGSPPVPELTSYVGTLTPRQLDSETSETEALHSGAAVHDLGWLRRVGVRGEDRFRWLSGMVTNGVESLPNGSGAYNLVLNAQGRIQGDCYVWRDSDELELEIAADQYEALTTHLDRFIIMDDVELVPLDGQSAIGVTGPESGIVLANLGLTPPPSELSSSTGMMGAIPVRIYRSYGMLVPHYTLWAAVQEIPALWEAMVAAGATPVGAGALETLRIVEGIPAFGIDIQSRDLAQETSQDRALSFTKGCYLGQEIVERIRSRGQVHRHLRSLEVFPDATRHTPAPGTELRIAGTLPDTKPVGNLTSIAALHRNGESRIFAIGMIRAEAEIGIRPLVYAGGTARILNTAPNWNTGPKAAEEAE